MPYLNYIREGEGERGREGGRTPDKEGNLDKSIEFVKYVCVYQRVKHKVREGKQTYLFDCNYLYSQISYTNTHKYMYIYMYIDTLLNTPTHTHTHTNTIL